MDGPNRRHMDRLVEQIVDIAEEAEFDLEYGFGVDPEKLGCALDSIVKRCAIIQRSLEASV
jgi:hypothetical protein